MHMYMSGIDQLLENDDLPKTICRECERKIAVTFEFRELCRKTERILKLHYDLRRTNESNWRITSDCNVGKDSKAEEDGSAYKRTDEKNEQAFEGEQQDWNGVWRNSKMVGSEQAAEENDEDDATGKDSGGVDGSSSNVQSHGDAVASVAETRYLCDVCSKTFASKSGLRFHMKSHGSAAKAHPCRYCGKGFAIPSYARRHERIHAGDKRFVCHFCSATFASSNGLKYHLRLHSGEANYHCETCGKSFYRRKYLNEHVFTHTGERPYVCKACGASYASSGSLFVHQKRCKNK
ncbi:hypothetical protein E2986_12364 [Frieseomelitta varia]|uniref:C2H2-type domain-containing protein n=1 Tax=Frieseomelitta varia TaxID=561572 RepID=A0A833W5K9_9HYME|nr:hypothetical protein E2986_12364 [Frieseomelitta varia]